ncbi:MAG: tRNA uridine-5-carboxymethylaminomethyl(34) synthesis GTPase MnmE [Flavobacteriales bacterium]|nr:tRNA uridine-5-carboxymethylaminomethyl(34) synthesis GTPase MnmE [Flavobacteriales bacterium]
MIALCFSNYVCHVNFKDPNDTIIALATGEAVAALSLIRISGKNSIPVVDKIFSKDIVNANSHTSHYGEIMDGDKTLDESVIFLFKGPSSFTGEDVVEITCHGSSFIRKRIMEIILEQGVRLADPGEFSMRAFLNRKMDLSQAESIADLIYSENEKQHALAMHQMKGGFKNELEYLRTKLIDFASLIELELDFSEEDVEFANREDLEQLIKEISLKLDQLIGSFQLGNVIKNGVYTVIAGRPNAGKSTLLNALLNEERAIVSDIPGTTRDVIEDSIHIGGIKFRLLDTAGIREATDKIESIGVQKTFESIEKSSILMYVFDPLELNEAELKKDIAYLKFKDEEVIIIANKSDKNKVSFQDSRMIEISAKEADGIDRVKEAMLHKVHVKDINRGDFVVSNLRHVEALKKAKRSLDEVEKAMSRNISGDLLSIDIRKALFHMGEITGEISSDDLLGNIFANFCIGK